MVAISLARMEGREFISNKICSSTVGMSKRVGHAFLFVLLFSYGYSQQYNYYFTDGWQATQLVETDDRNYIIGLGNNINGHAWQLTVLEANMYKLNDTSLQANGFESSLNASFNVLLLVDNKIVLSGVQVHNGNYGDGLIGVVDLANVDIIKVETFNIKYRTFNLQTFSNDTSQFVSFGIYLTDTTQLRRRINSFLCKFRDTVVYIKPFSCSDYNSDGGCELVFRNALQLANKGYLLAAEANAYYEKDYKHGLIIKTDSMGNEQWRLGVGNDSTSCHNLLVAPLANGHYLAMWQDYYYKPYKGPDNNRNPVTSKNVTGWFLEFDTSGNVIRKWKFRDVASARVTSPDILYFNHLITTKDSGIAITGNTRDYGTNGLDLGFLLKLDKYGNYQWYRQYEVNVAKPYTLGEEKLFLNGVTELSNGGFALAGEYRSDASDSFPDGAQKGVVLFVDEYGCMKPGCQLTDNVNDLQTKLNIFKVFPNPSVGVLDISSEKLDIRLHKIEIFDMQGRVVFEETPIGTATRLSSNISSLASNIYYLKIYRNDGYTETHKIIKQ